MYKHICIDTDKFLLLLGVPRSCNTLVAISTPSILFRVPVISKYHAQTKTNCNLLGEVVESKIGADKVHNESWTSMPGGKKVPTKHGAVSKNIGLTRKLPVVDDPEQECGSQGMTTHRVN